MKKLHRKHIAYGPLVVALIIFAALGTKLVFFSHAITPSSAPTAPPVTWCETGMSADPYTSAPSGAIVITPANASSYSASYQETQNTTYWFTPGTYDNVGFQPQTGDTFIGGYDPSTHEGVTLDGGGSVEDAFDGFDGSNGSFDTKNVTIEYFTITDYTGGGSGQANVNHDGNSDWTIEDNDIENTTEGAGVGMGSGDVVTNNCLDNNAEYGFNGFGGSSNVTLTNNDIAYNNSGDMYDHPGSPINCGCSGGGKFWVNSDATVTGNYVHDNGGVGIWVDTDNAGFNISDNYVANNYGEGIMYEASYNAQIVNNTLIGNGIGAGTAAGGGSWTPAIYISESGSNPSVDTPYNSQFLVSGNVLTNNWGGILLWENANRYCSDGGDNPNCTLNDPSIYTVSSCAANLSEKSPTDYYDNCRWKVMNVSVTDNDLTLDPSAVGANCTPANGCGLNGIFSDYGNAPYSSSSISTAITFNQNNHFADNTYTGPWIFWAWNQGNLDNPISWADWTGAVTDGCATSGEIQSGTCNSGFGQDAGSTFNNQVTPTTPPPVAPTNLSATVNSSTSVSLTWSAATDNGGPGVDGYYVLRNGVNLTPSGVKTTTYTDTTAAASTTYDYTVEAFDSASPPNVSQPSAAVSVTTPAPPSSSSSGATSSESGSPTGGNVLEDKTFENGTDNMTAWFNDSVTQSNAMAHSGSYSLAVTAVPTAGQGSNWGITELWPGQATVTPGTTYNFSAWVRAGSHPESITEQVNWIGSNDSNVVAPVSVDTVTDNSSGWTEITGSAVAPTGALHAALTFSSPAASPNEVHYFDDITVTTTGTTQTVTTPTVPTNIMAKAASPTTVNLTWSAATDSGGPAISGYYVLRNGVNLTPSGVKTTGYTDNTAVAGTTYNYQIEAYNSSGTISQPSAAVSVITPQPPAPVAPTQPTGLKAVAASSSQINLSWQASTDPNGVAGYYVYRNGSQVAKVTTTSYGDTGLSTSTAYSYYVVAFDGSGNKSTVSSTVKATTQAISTTTTVEGVVKNSLTGYAINGVYVLTITAGKPSSLIYTQTNSAGQYVLSGLTANKASYFAFSASGYKAAIYDWKLPTGTTVKNVSLTPPIDHYLSRK